MSAQKGSGTRLMAALVLVCATAVAGAAGVSGAQERAAAEFLAAAASGHPQALAEALHPDELHRLRTAISARLTADAASGDQTARQRLFGEASNLGDIERLTDVNFFAAIATRLRLPGRVFAKVKGLEAFRDGDQLVRVLVRGEQPEGRGKTRVVTLVTLLPYGKDWKAALPGELEAQIEDLVDGRAPVAGFMPRRAPAVAAGGAAAAAAPSATNTPQMRSLLTQAARALIDGRCADYYGTYMSPGFRGATSAGAMQALVKGCERNDSQRETLVAALRIVQDASPVFERGGTRAVYDTTGRGLPFDRFVLERIGDRWYIAE
ncbi:MAG: hypothetical protein AB7G76_00285 [Steroidobacteraceae bacterium]